MGRAMLDINGLESNAVFDKKIPNVDVPGIGAGRSAPVLLEANGAHVVLVKNILLEGISLDGQKLLSPNGIGEIVACSNQLGLRGALHVKFLLGGFAHDGSDAERDNTTGVTFLVIVNGVRGVHPCLHQTKVVGAKSKELVETAP